jgi:hypothetical protein
VIDTSTGSLYFHRMLAVSLLVNGNRYSQVSSRNHRVVHSRKASMHIAIHKVPRVVCRWSRV